MNRTNNVRINFTRSGWRQFGRMNHGLDARFIKGYILRRELAELNNQAQTLIYTSEQALEGYADLISEDAAEAVRQHVEVLKQTVCKPVLTALEALPTPDDPRLEQVERALTVLQEAS